MYAKLIVALCAVSFAHASGLLGAAPLAYSGHAIAAPAIATYAAAPAITYQFSHYNTININVDDYDNYFVKNVSEMNVKLEVLLCVVSVAFASAFYNQAPVVYNPYYSFGGYPIGTQEEYEYYDNSYGRAPVAAAYSTAQQNQAPFVAYNTRVVSPAFHPTAAPVASNVQVTSAPVQAVQPTGFSTTPVPLTDVNVVSQQQQLPVVPAVSTTVAPILSKSNQLGLVYPHTGIAPAVSTYGANNVVATSNLGNVNFQSFVNPTIATPDVYSTTQNPIVTSNINVPAVVAAKSNVVPYPYFNPHLNNIFSSSGYNFALNQGTNYNVDPTLIKTNVSYVVPYAGNPGGYISTPTDWSQNGYVPFISNQAFNNGNLYSSTASKFNVPLQPSSGIINPTLYHSTPNPPVQNVFGSGSSFASTLSQPQIFPTGNLVGSVPESAAPVNAMATANSFNSFPRLPQPVIATVSPKDASNIISYSTTTPRAFDGFVPVTSTYTSVKKQTIYAAPPIVSQPNAPSLYYTGSASPMTYNINSNRLLQNQLVANQGLLYASTPVSTLSPSVSHNGSPSPVIYSTIPAPITTTTPAPTTSNQEISSQVTTTARPTIITTQRPSSSTTYITNETTKLVTSPITTQSFNNYVSKTGVQSATTLRPSTIQNTVSKVSFSTVRPESTQTASYVPSFSVTKPIAISVANPTLTSKTQTVKYPLKPASSIATSSTTQSNFFTQRPTIASIQRQDAFAASLSEFSKPSTYKPPATNYYVPFVNIPASTGYVSSSISSNQKKDFIPIVSNYEKGLNVIIQPPITSETGATVAPSILDYSSTYVSQSTPPPEAVSSFVHSDQYLPPVLPVISDVGSNVVSYISEPVVTSTVGTPFVVSTTPRTLPLSYPSPGQEEKVVAYTNQATVKPVVYTTTPVITKVDLSPTLTPLSYAVPVSSEYAQLPSEQPLAYSDSPAVTTVNYV
ncbi:hypothetical protein K1T71_001185 [Dendrolimus kikuchii]|uniref:Uncharacterized protein n=1 Tax=Dendrolimus kikuchii TaxID=765133 RepID=A0ACC1DGX0_9NEOP|nr:hypothetical protein K1T71_001185 [Dendrolimus kikuchii]